MPGNSRLPVRTMHTSGSATWKPRLAVSGHVHEHRGGACGGRAGPGQHRGGRGVRTFHSPRALPESTMQHLAK